MLGGCDGRRRGDRVFEPNVVGATPAGTPMRCV